MSTLGQKQTFAPQKVMSALPPRHQMRHMECQLSAKSGHLPLYSITSSARASSNGGGNANTSWYCETERDRQPRAKRGIKFLIAADCDLTATRAAALDLQQADELARVFAKSNTRRPTGLADLVRSTDTSRSSQSRLDIPGIQRCACRDPARQAR